jgi:hypothetical protein
MKITMKAQLSLNNVALTAVDTFATVAERIHELEQAFSQLLSEIKVYNSNGHDVHIYTDGAAKGILEMVVMECWEWVGKPYKKELVLGELRIIEWNYWL